MNVKIDSPSLAEIFKASFSSYLLKHGPVPVQQYTVANAIINCRSEKLGARRYQCPECGHQRVLYNSCRNRHCPQCQAQQRAAWVQKRMDELLPVPYFHVVFTLPAQLRPVALRNKKNVHGMLLAAVNETLTKLAADRRFLGGQPGFILVLHTWGQNLMDHPHVHCIMPAGVLDKKNNRWISCGKKFLFPIPVLQKLFRGIFMDKLRKAVDAAELYPGEGIVLENITNELYSLKWVVYVKKPFASPVRLVKYLGRYTNRIAIANNRIQKMNADKVQFSYKNYARKGVTQTMQLQSTEFIRRFMLHVVPHRFMRIRHCGFLSNKAKKKLVPLCRIAISQAKTPVSTDLAVLQKCLNKNSESQWQKCPICTRGILLCVEFIQPLINVSAKEGSH